MPKDAMIVIRTPEPTKTRLKRAAEASHRSLTSFLLEAGLRAADEVEARQEAHGATIVRESGPQYGAPEFFRALCREATEGGASTYRRAGRELARHTVRLLESGAAPDPSAALQDLSRALNANDRDAVIAWYTRYLPQCMSLVPPRRRGLFVAGVLEAEDTGFPHRSATRAPRATRGRPRKFVE